MKKHYTVFALVGLVFVIIVADAVDRWALSYPLLRSDDGDSANPAALWSLEVGRFLVAVSLVGVGAVVFCRRPTALVAIPYAIVGALGSSARPTLLLTHGDIPLLRPPLFFGRRRGTCSRRLHSPACWLSASLRFSCCMRDAPNHAMERTADSFGSLFSMKFDAQLAATRSPASRRSSG